jgi:NitT/TauT family transport system substrate-binding protein
MLPQPYVTTVMMNNDKVRIALDVAKEWDAEM